MKHQERLLQMGSVSLPEGINEPRKHCQHLRRWQAGAARVGVARAGAARVVQRLEAVRDSRRIWRVWWDQRAEPGAFLLLRVLAYVIAGCQYS